MSINPKHRAQPPGPEHPAGPMLRGALLVLAVLVIGTIVVLVLGGCTATPSPSPGSQGQTLEQLVRTEAIAKDSRFSDDEVWHYAKETAGTYCDLADEGGRTFADAASAMVAEDSGVDTTALRVVQDIALTLYCPEYQ